MMKKISKLLAVVLAVAMLICPAMCLTSMAETSTDAYTLNYADGVLTVNVAPGEDFLVSLLKIDIEGYIVDEDNIAVTTEEGVSFSANPSYENGVLTLLLASKEAANVHLVSSATVTIPATKDESASKYYIALTNIQVATTGTADAPDSFIAIDGVNADGAVANVVPVVNETAGPALDEAIEISTHTIAIGETIGVGFRFKLSSLNSEYASYKLDIKRTTTTGDFNFSYAYDTLTTYNKIAAQDAIAFGTYYGIELFSLTAPLEYTLRCFDAEGNEVAYSKTFTTTLADVAVAYHNLSTTSNAIKKVMADLIQVGAAALNHFTANRTKAVDYSTLPVPTIDSAFTTTTLGSLASYNTSSGVKVTITGAIQTSPYFNMRFSENVANKDQYKFEVSFYNALTKKTDTYTVTSADMVGNTTTISTKLTTFPIFATNADVTFTLYKNNSVVGTQHYCLEKYIADTMATTKSETLKTLLQEVGELSQSIRTARKI